MQIWVKKLVDLPDGDSEDMSLILTQTFVWYCKYGQSGNGEAIENRLLSGMTEYQAMFFDIWPDEWAEAEEEKEIGGSGRRYYGELHDIEAIKKIKVKPKYWKNQKDQSQRLYNCPGLHGLATFVTTHHGYYCNECGKCFNRGTEFHGCRICDFDLCYKCYKPPHIDHITNGAGDGGTKGYNNYGRKGSLHQQVHSNSQMMIEMGVTNDSKPEKEYKIYFEVDIRIHDEDDLANKITKTEKIKQPFHEIFKTKQESHVFDVKTRVRPGDKAFELEFAIKIATALHPADYIEIFDELSSQKNPQIQDALIDAFDFKNDPEIHNWEARYEKVDDEGPSDRRWSVVGWNEYEQKDSAHQQVESNSQVVIQMQNHHKSSV